MPFLSWYESTERDNIKIYVMILLMAEILHQLIGSFPIIYRVSYIPGGAGFQPSTVCDYTMIVVLNVPQKSPALDRRYL